MKSWKVKTLIGGSVILVLVAAIYYYIMLPAVNIHSPGFWKFIIFVCAAGTLIYALFRVRLKTIPVYNQNGRAGNTVSMEYKTPKDKILFRIFLGITIGLVAVFIIGGILSSEMINASRYQKLLTVETRSFENDIKEVSYDQIPILDRESAITIGNRVMGTMVDMVSQYEINHMYSQINYGNKPVRVSPLQYGSLIKWLTNNASGIPGYVRIDMTTQNAEIVRLNEGIKYSESDHF